MFKNKKLLKKVAIAILCFVLILIFYEPKEFTSNGELKIHFIDVGQADSILITLNDSAMLIDAGNNGDGDLVVDYLKSVNVTTLNYLIGTHPHEDHIGGLDDVINNTDIQTVLMPKAQTNTKTFEDVLDSLAAKNLKITTTKVGDTYELDAAKFTVLSVKNETPENLNTCSIVIRLEYGNKSFLFCGDAEVENEKEMLKADFSLSSDVIKVGHHGSDTSSDPKFIQVVNPEIAIISTGKDNKFGHPHQQTLDLLKKFGIKTFRTDENGTIIITSDGTSLDVTCERK